MGKPKLSICAAELAGMIGEKDIKHLKEFGVSWIELYFTGNVDKNNAKKVKELFDSNKLGVSALNTWTEWYWDESKIKDGSLVKHLQDALSVAKILKTKNMIVYGALGDSEVNNEQEIAEYIKRMEPIAKAAKEENITLVLENDFHIKGRELTRRALTVKKLVKQFNRDNFLINFDPCNFMVAGEEPYPYAYGVIKEYIGYMHIKDATRYVPEKHGEVPLQTDLSGKYACTPAGEGAVNYTGLIKQLLEDGYDGFLSVEPHVRKEIVDETVKKGTNFLGKCGVIS
ncbi:MAG: hypothetical protein A2231_02210 [Candidatus Firestonebacteria bacterium RIFOXYA2_FULL_40_8]|nr:MAG: hypothetical protein A2231_02210 [Candidatus Firestonebacteria bacterium RIFOXYA2_FULL_40_8]